MQEVTTLDTSCFIVFATCARYGQIPTLVLVYCPLSLDQVIKLIQLLGDPMLRPRLHNSDVRAAFMT